MSHLLGIDLGTSSVKVVLADSAGQILGRGSADYPISQPRPGWAEQDPQDWQQATQVAVQQALAQAGQSPDLAAIGLSGQMHGTVLLDAAGQVLYPAVIWPDQRSAQQVQEITAAMGAERLIELTGSPLATGFQAATLRWMQTHRPDLWQQVRQILLPKDYLRWWLTGRFATDPSDGSGTLLLDVHTRNWAPEMLALVGVDPAWLPPVQPAVTLAGELQPAAATILGLPAGVPVITGAADTACSLLGAGVIHADTLLITISTGGQVVIPTMTVEVDRAGRIHTFCSALEPAPGQAGWYQMGAILSAGLALRWLRDRVFALEGETAYAQMTAWAETVPIGAKGLLFVPYLVGERTPHMDPRARGAFLGLTLQHGRPELVRAVMEGVGMACYDAFRVLAALGAQPRRMVLAGGGAQSRLWQQIFADLFGWPVQRLAVTDQSAWGAVLLAGVGCGMFEMGERGPAWATCDAPVEPQPAHHARYQAIFELYQTIYPKHRADFQQHELFYEPEN